MIDVAHLGGNGSPEECSLADVLVKIHINPSLAGSQGLGHPYKACSGVLKRRDFFFLFWPGEKNEAILWECTVKQRLWIMVQRETTRIFCGTLKRLVSSFLLVRTSRIALSLHKEL